MPEIYLIPNVLAPDTQVSHLAPLVPELIERCDVFFVEELRTARRFISSLKLGLVIEDLLFEKLNKDTDYGAVKQLFNTHQGKTIGVISEAGCPCIADPGSLAALVAHEHGYKVIPVPGPSSIFLALMASGFKGQKFTFSGYLTIQKKDKLQEIKQLERDAQNGVTQIFMETPYRNDQLLQDLIETCQPTTFLSVAANLTSKNEYIATKSVGEWRAMDTKPSLHKQPTIFLLNCFPK